MAPPWRSSARWRAPRATRAGDDRARLAVGRRRELRRGDRRHLDLDVDAVEQRPADPALVAQHRVGRAAARRRRRCRAGRTGTGSSPRRAGTRPGSRPGAPPARRRCGRSRAARATPRARRAGTPASSSRKRTPRWASDASPGRGGEPPPTSAAADAVWCGARSTRSPQRDGAEGAGDAQDRRRLERLVVRQRRQQAGEAARQHRLAGARRADHQQAQLPGGGDLERALGGGSGRARRRDRAAPASRAAAADAARAARSRRRRRRAGARARRRAGDRRRAPTRPPTSADSSALACGSTSVRGVAAGVRCSASAIASAPCTGRSWPPSESSPANSNASSRARVDLAGGGEDAERDRQVEAARFLRQVGRREADGDALVVRELEAARLQRRADALARFLDLGVGQADQREARQAVGEVHFDRHRRRVEAAQGAAADEGEGHAGRFSGAIVRAPRRPKAGTPRGAEAFAWCPSAGDRRRARSVAGARAGATAFGTQRAKRGAISTKVPGIHDEALTDPVAPPHRRLARPRRRRPRRRRAAAPEVKSDWTITGNAGVFSDYRFRGISQTNKKPAFQGGFDIGHASGFYVGNWNSNIDSSFYNGANLEMDFYGGYKLPVGPVALDFGALYYYYPGSGAGGTFTDRQHRALRQRRLRPGQRQVLARDQRLLRHRRLEELLVPRRQRQLRGRAPASSIVGHVGYQKLKRNARSSRWARRSLDRQHHRLEGRRDLRPERLRPRRGVRRHQPRPDRRQPLRSPTATSATAPSCVSVSKSF